MQFQPRGWRIFSVSESRIQFAFPAQDRRGRQKSPKMSATAFLSVPMLRADRRLGESKRKKEAPANAGASWNAEKLRTERLRRFALARRPRRAKPERCPCDPACESKMP
jgi:hypothetical protein